MPVRFALLAPFVAVLVALTALPDHGHAAFFTTNVVGDANCDGHLTGADALAVAVDLADIDPPAPCIAVANVYCEDALNTDDLIALLRYLAGLPIDAPSRCFAPGREIDTQPVSQGTATIHGTHSFDFDAGAEVGSDGDVFWENLDTSDPIDMKLVTDVGQTAVLPGADYDALNVVFLNATPYSDDDIDGPDGPVAAPDGPNDLSPGTVFAVKTDMGNYAKVKVTSSGYNLEIEWVTYSGTI